MRVQIESSGTTFSCPQDLNPENTFCPFSTHRRIHTGTYSKQIVFLSFLTSVFFEAPRWFFTPCICYTIYFLFISMVHIDSPSLTLQSVLEKFPEGPDTHYRGPVIDGMCHCRHTPPSPYLFFLVLGVSQSNMTHQWIYILFSRSKPDILHFHRTMSWYLYLWHCSCTMVRHVLFYLQLVNSIAKTYVGTNAYMAVSCPCFY